MKNERPPSLGVYRALEPKGDALDQQIGDALATLGWAQCFNQELSRDWMAHLISGLRHEIVRAHDRGVTEAAKAVEAHCCVSTCCDAQPSSGEASALAECVRRLVARTERTQ